MSTVSSAILSFSSDYKRALFQDEEFCVLFLQLLAALHGPLEGDLVGVFQIAPHGDAVGQAGDLYPQGL